MSLPYRMCGGKNKVPLTAADQLFLSICLYIYPSASSDELCIFIIVNGGEVYTQQHVTRRFLELGITRKRLLSEACYTFSEALIRKAL